MATTDELFTTYGPTFFRAIPARALQELNDIRKKEGQDPIAASGLSGSWKTAEEVAQTWERKGGLPTDPRSFIIRY